MELKFTNGNLGKCTTTVEVALELKINQTNTSITILKSSSAKLMGIRAAWHQRSSWAQPSGTGTAIFKPSC